MIETDIGALAKNIAQDASNRFVSDTEKSTWNGKTDDTLISVINGSSTDTINIGGSGGLERININSNHAVEIRGSNHISMNTNSIDFNTNYLMRRGHSIPVMITGTFSTASTMITINLGYEPEFVLVRRQSNVCLGSDSYLTGKDFTWSSDHISGGNAGISRQTTGFIFTTKSGSTNQEYAYVAFG